MKLSSKLAVFLCLWGMFLAPSKGLAGEPTTQLSATIDEFVNILVKTPVAELRSTGLPDRALKLIHGRFDFSEMTKRSLGSHWGVLSAREQGEFVGAYTQMLLRFFGRSVRSAGDETIQYRREVQEGLLASVETKVVSSSGANNLPVDYLLHDIDGQWKVYDVVIDNISIVNNYRAQFERIIAKSSVQDLLQKMKQMES
ncbi:MAG TPA: ABC transporter substrate-binding protein [Candidatus Binatia bacterium]|nr:ABC transporter substrate-binding protein [Candidatus Binatia bacterium]